MLGKGADGGAALNGHLEVAKYLFNALHSVGRIYMRQCCRMWSPGVAEMDKANQCLWDTRTSSAAAEGGHLKLLNGSGRTISMG